VTPSPDSPHEAAPSARPPRDGFSVASLAAFLARTLADIDPALIPDGFALATLRDTRTSIVREKRRLATHAFAVGGAAPLLEVGRRLRGIALHPGIAVLIDPPTPEALRERWMRRERYQRYPHRVEIVAEGERSWRCTLRTSGTPLSFAETVLLGGILAGLLDLVGARDVDVSFDDVGPGAADDPGRTRRFALRWTGMDAAGAVDVSSARHRRPSDMRAGTNRAVATHVRALLDEDVVRRWTLAEVAATLHLSSRSLQRALAADGHAFSTIVRESRVAEAARLLRDTDHSLELVGFTAGFADQPHFQREFARALDVTPADYRRVARTGSTDRAPPERS